MLYVDCKTWLPDYLLLRGDKLTMANSIEGRVPLLDHELVEFACGLPNHLRINGTSRKYLLKKVAERFLPAEIVHRKKQGFPIPVDRWLRQEANSMMHELLDPAELKERGMFDPSAVAKLIHRHESGYADHSVELWGLMSVELWFQSFVDAQSGEIAKHSAQLAPII
jgi:asparagine synthase (glutamine-hydrolysing)